MCVCAPCVYSALQKSKEVRFLGTGIMDGHELPCGSWELSASSGGVPPLSCFSSPLLKF